MDKRCSCLADKVANHLAKLTPILGAVDLMAQVKGIESPRPPPGEPSKDILRRVLAARKMQEARHRAKKVLAGWNSMLDLADLVPMVERETERLLGDALDRLGLSTTDYVKVLRVARTVADLDGCEKIRTIHAAEAVSVVAYRGSSLFGVSS
jgi:magnesium chelatase family protein